MAGKWRAALVVQGEKEGEMFDIFERIDMSDISKTSNISEAASHESLDIR